MSLPLSAAAPFFFNNTTMRTSEFLRVETGVNFYIYALNDANDRIHRFPSFESVSNVMSPTNEKALESGNWIGMSVGSDDRIYVINRDGGIIRYDDWDDNDPDSKNDVPNLGWEGISVYNDELYLLDNTQKRIYRYSDWNDEDPESFALLPRGDWQGINVDNDRRIYLLDVLTKQIARYDRWEDIGTLQPDRKDTGLGVLTYGLAVRNGTIYIIDQNNNRIWRYIKWESNNIEYRELPSGTWSGMATSGYEIGDWAGISVHTNEDDNLDNIYALNKANKQIARYESWQSVKDGDTPDTKDIDDLEIDVKHTPLYFVDHTYEQIHKFYDDSLDVNRSETIDLNAPNAYVVTGNQIDHYELLDNPTPDNTKSLPAETEIIYGLNNSDNRLLRYSSLSDTNPDTKDLDNGDWRGVATNSNGQIFVLSNTGITRYQSWDDTNPNTKSIPSGDWVGISIDGNTIYLIDNQDDKIIRFTSWGNVSNTITSNQEKASFPGAYVGISVNNGAIYILSNDIITKRIIKYDSWDDIVVSGPGGTNLTPYKEIVLINGNLSGISVHTDSSGNGNIYITGNSIRGPGLIEFSFIEKYTSQTDTNPTVHEIDTVLPLLHLDEIDVQLTTTDYSGIGIDGNNKFYVVDNRSNKILRLDNLNLSTTPEYKIIPNSEWRGITIPPLTIGITIPNQDYIYLIDNGRNRIARYTSWEDSQPDYKNIGDGHWLGIAASGDNLYLLDNGLPGKRSRVVRYSSWNSNNPTENYLPANVKGWEGISTDSRNRIYVLRASTIPNQIYQYASWNEWEDPPIITTTSIATSSSAKGIGINIPRAKNWAGVSVRNRNDRINNQIYSISDNEKRIYRLSINQNRINRESKRIQGNARWVGISITNTQQIFAVDQLNNRVMRLPSWSTPIRDAEYKDLPTNERTQWYGPSVDGNHIYFINNLLNRIARYPAWGDWDDDTVPDYKNIAGSPDYKGISVQNGKIYLVDNSNDFLVTYNDWNDSEPTAVNRLPRGGWHGIAIGNEETDTITYNNWAGLSVITLIDTTSMMAEDSPMIVVAECDTKRIGVYENWDDTTMFHDPRLIIDQSKHRISLGDRYDSYYNNELYVLDNANNRVLRYATDYSTGDLQVADDPPETMQLGINADWQGISIFRGQIYVLDNTDKRVVCYKSFEDNVNPVSIEPDFRSSVDKQKWANSELAGLSKLKKYLYTVDNISNSFIRFPISN